MKTFNAVDRKSKFQYLSERQNNIDRDKSRLVAAIKAEYGINDFSKLNESEKASYREMICEMWNKNTGLTDKGIAFINEGKQLLTSKSTQQDIENYFKKKVRANVGKCMQSLVLGDKCDIVANIKSDIEEQIGKKLPASKCKKWMFDVCAKNLAESVKSLNFNEVNE